MVARIIVPFALLAASIIAAAGPRPSARAATEAPDAPDLPNTLDAGPVIDHTSLAAFNALSPGQIAAARALRVLFVDHSVGENINQGLSCYAAASVAAAPSFCKRFAHVDPSLSADPAWFHFGAQYDRSNWVYHAGASSYWREWPGQVDGLLQDQPDWDVVIMMPSYLVAPNGGWQPYEELEAKYPDIRFVVATSSLPRGAAGGTEGDLRMRTFNQAARDYALAQGKPFLDVADLLSHDYQGQPCFDTRDGKPYCRDANNCENLPDDGVDIPAICQHYTSEFYGGHLGNVSGGMLRMAQAMWLLMARMAEEGASTQTPPGTQTPARTSESTATSAASTPSAIPTEPTDAGRLFLPRLESGATAGLPAASPTPQRGPTIPPRPTPGVTPTAASLAPYPDAPACAEHDPLVWHALWDPRRGCHYDHHHGDDPHAVDDLFGTVYLAETGGDVAIRWQPAPTSLVDGARKHNGLFWMVRRDLPCTSAYGTGCITDFRAEVHMLTDIHDLVRAGGREGSFHVARIEARGCLLSDPDRCGIVRLAGRQYLGDTVVDNTLVFDVPEPRDLWETRTPAPRALNYWAIGNRSFTTWYPVNPSGLLRIAVEVADVWAPVDPADPFANRLSATGNQSAIQAHVVGIDLSPWVTEVVDPDGDAIADWSGYLDVNGFFTDACAAGGPGCVPVRYEGLPVPPTEPGRSHYQYRGDYHEHDVLFEGRSSGWLRYPGMPAAGLAAGAIGAVGWPGLGGHCGGRDG